MVASSTDDCKVVSSNPDTTERRSAKKAELGKAETFLINRPSPASFTFIF